MQTIEQFIENNQGLELSVICIKDRPDVDVKDEWHNPKNPNDKPFNYKCILSGNNSSYEFYYSKGIGHGKRINAIKGNSIWANNERKAVRKADHIDNKPTLSEVLDSLAMDASDFLYGIDFEEWAENLGYDMDSRKAEKIYKACQNNFNGLLRVLGMDALCELIEDTERE